MQDRIVHELLERSVTIAEKWHRELHEYLGIRPREVFSGDELLDHMPGAIRWVIGSIQRDEPVGLPSVEAVGETARHWRDAGYSVEESLMHMRSLSRLLHHEIREISSAMTPRPDPKTVSLVSERMSYGIMLLQAILVGAYRDEQEERLDGVVNMLVHEIRNPLGSALTGLRTLDLLEEDGSAGGGTWRVGANRSARVSPTHCTRPTR